VRAGIKAKPRKEETMTVLNIKPVSTQESKPGFFGRLWQSVLRFDEALNFDPRDDLARRTADLEKKSKA
jgi:hypothetical protein